MPSGEDSKKNHCLLLLLLKDHGNLVTTEWQDLKIWICAYLLYENTKRNALSALTPNRKSFSDLGLR